PDAWRPARPPEPEPSCGRSRVSRTWRGFLAERQEPPGQSRSGPGVFVLEEHEGLTPGGPDALNRLDPSPQAVVGVLHRAEPEIAEVGCRDGRRRALLGVGDAEGGVPRLQ